MEWLRSVDLAEYAPNLRGSGVHGGLMVGKPWFQFPSRASTLQPLISGLSVQVLEPRFNVETMALLLNIPPNKTLLRRHLATHFSLLIGAEAQQLKQECLENPDYTVLTATTKVKVVIEMKRTCNLKLEVLLSFGHEFFLTIKGTEQNTYFNCTQNYSKKNN